VFGSCLLTSDNHHSAGEYLVPQVESQETRTSYARTSRLARRAVVSLNGLAEPDWTVTQKRLPDAKQSMEPCSGN